jgi:exopolysaccharide production protein ExoZ
MVADGGRFSDYPCGHGSGAQRLASGLPCADTYYHPQGPQCEGTVNNRLTARERLPGGRPGPGGAAGPIVSVQYLRGIAAFMVLLNHVAWKVQQRGSHVLDGFGIGEAGVDIFFIVSGFIMCHITAGPRVDIREFVRNRCIRILPLYWILTTVALGIFLIAPERVNTSGGSTHLLASYLLVPVNGKFLVQAGWTLSYEFYFYLVFAVGLLFGARLGPLLAALALVTLAGLGSWHASDATAWSFLTNNLLLEFVAGIGLYGAHRLRLVRRRWVAWLMLAAGVLIFVAENRSEDRTFLSPVRAIRYGLPALLVCWGMVSLERPIARHRIRWLERLGDISYSLYLSHAFSIGACGLLLARVPASGRWGGWLLTGVLLAAALLGAELCYRVIELPTRRALRTRLGTRVKLAPALRDPAPARG